MIVNRIILAGEECLGRWRKILFRVEQGGSLTLLESS